jgi:adenosylhomocysteine nucleosidase
VLGPRSDPALSLPLTRIPPGELPLGVVAALRAEGRCLMPRSAPLGAGVTVRLSGIGPARARCTAARLVATGVKALVSWGVAGGIAPPLPAGTLLLPTHVQASGGQTYQVDKAWRQRLMEHVEGKLPCSGAPLYHTTRILSAVEEKAALYRHTGCAGVDMESAAIGEVAAQAGLPFLIVRAIADPAAAALPATALQALDEAGRLQWLALATSLLHHPQDLLGLWQLAGYFRAARTTLRTLAAQVGPTLLAPSCP